jgi:hypothetical protein
MKIIYIEIYLSNLQQELTLETTILYENFKSFLESQSIEIPEYIEAISFEKSKTTRTIATQTENLIQKKNAQAQTEPSTKIEEEICNSSVLKDLMILDFKIRSLKN